MSPVNKSFDPLEKKAKLYVSAGLLIAYYIIGCFQTVCVSVCVHAHSHLSFFSVSAQNIQEKPFSAVTTLTAQTSVRSQEVMRLA